MGTLKLLVELSTSFSFKTQTLKLSPTSCSLSSPCQCVWAEKLFVYFSSVSPLSVCVQYQTY